MAERSSVIVPRVPWSEVTGSAEFEVGGAALLVVLALSLVVGEEIGQCRHDDRRIDASIREWKEREMNEGYMYLGMYATT